MKDLNNRWFVVTGGVSGLGEAVSRLLVKQGAKVLMLDVNEQRGQQVQNELSKNSLFCKTNITKENEVLDALKKAKEQFSSSKLSGVINCAGIAWARTVVSKQKGVHPLEEFRRVIEVNVIGSFNVSRLVCQQIVQESDFKENRLQDQGIVINVASIAAFDGQIGQAAYSASKGAVHAMTLPIARELSRYGIRCATVAPGVFETPMGAGLPKQAQESLAKQIPFPARFGQPHEFADLILHMIQNEYINGETIRIDGSIRMSSM